MFHIYSLSSLEDFLTLTSCRDLSHGHFSSDSQILISDTENAVPIFKANVSGDTRLIVRFHDHPTHEIQLSPAIFSVVSSRLCGRLRNRGEYHGISRSTTRHVLTYHAQVEYQGERTIVLMQTYIAYNSLWRVALRIFGAYNHAELGRMGSNFWDALGRDLGRKGKSYRDQ